MSSNNIFSLTIYIVTFLISYILIFRTKKFSNIKIILFLYLMILIFFSYKYIPLTEVDLTRLQKSLISLKGISFDEIIKMIPNTADYSRLLYFWIISKLGNNNLMQAGATLLFYSVIFYILYDYSKSQGFSCKTVAKVFLIFMLQGQFIFVVSGVRTAMAFALFVYCYYNETFKNKKIISNIILYLIAIGFHTAVVPIFFIRIAYAIFDKNTQGGNKILNIVLVIIVLAVSALYGSGIIDSFFNKAKDYINTSLYYNKPEYLLSVIKNVLYLICFLKYYKLENKTVTLTYVNSVVYLYVITLVFAFQYTIFTRYTYLIEILFLPIFLELIDELQRKLKKNSIKTFSLFMCILVFMIFVLSFLKANMSVLNFY